MRKKIVAGNWKMNGTSDTIASLLTTMTHLLNNPLIPECVLFPPSPYLTLVKNIIDNKNILLGAQNVYPRQSGAFTGEVSGPMLKELGCQYVIVGHSERRIYFHEDEKFVADKFHHVKEHDMIPVLCVGETLVEREQGLTLAVLESQLGAIASNDAMAFEGCVIAYEPVWAIGTGLTASPEQVQSDHEELRKLIAKLSKVDPETVTLLYGGSVNEKNAKALFDMPDVDGGLIGGASLNAQQFAEIVKCIN